MFVIEQFRHIQFELFVFACVLIMAKKCFLLLSIVASVFSRQSLHWPGWLSMHALSQQHPASYLQSDTFTHTVFQCWTRVWDWACGSRAYPLYVSTVKIFPNLIVLLRGFRWTSFPQLVLLTSPHLHLLWGAFVTVAPEKPTLGQKWFCSHGS